MLTNRERFIKDFFSFLQNEEYVLLKYIEPYISSIGEYSDIDLAITSKSAQKIQEYIKSYENISNFKVYSSSFMKMIYIVFKDNSFLEVDLILRFIRKDIEYLCVDEMLNNFCLNDERIKVPNNKYSFLYVFLFYILNHSSVDKKYEHYFISLSEEEQKVILKFINERFSLVEMNISNLCLFNNNIYRKVYTVIKSENSLPGRLKRQYLYFFDTFTNYKKSKAIIIDAMIGESKLDVIDKFIDILENKYRRNVMKMQCGFSVFKIFNTIKYRFRGYILIYADCYTKNLDNSNSIPNKLYRFILSPELNILLEKKQKTLEHKEIVAMLKKIDNEKYYIVEETTAENILFKIEKLYGTIL